MTQPTGRSRGRPKTKEYVTLMARVDIALASQVKRYASLHRQPVSVVIRDALTLLMEEYPVAADRSGPQRLAAHEFLADRYESPLDMLIGETDSAGLEALLSASHEEVVETILSDTPAAMAARTSDSNTARANTHTETLTPGRSRTVSNRKAAQAVPQASSTTDTPPSLSDAKAALSEAPQRRRGRQSGPMHQGILTLLADHPEGLSAHDLRVSLKADIRIGETLQGLRQAGVVTTRGRGKAMRYVVAEPS